MTQPVEPVDTEIPDLTFIQEPKLRAIVSDYLSWDKVCVLRVGYLLSIFFCRLNVLRLYSVVNQIGYATCSNRVG
jgi:hypothetical protein